MGRHERGAKEKLYNIQSELVGRIISPRCSLK